MNRRTFIQNFLSFVAAKLPLPAPADSKHSLDDFLQGRVIWQVINQKDGTVALFLSGGVTIICDNLELDVDA